MAASAACRVMDAEVARNGEINDLKCIRWSRKIEAGQKLSYVKIFTGSPIGSVMCVVLEAIVNTTPTAGMSLLEVQHNTDDDNTMWNGLL